MATTIRADVSRLVGAQAAYKDFLALWNAADQDLPLLKQSQLEFARIEGVNH